MSTIIMSACWPLQMSPAQKSVLISLADNANDEGVCWPSVKAISVRCCLSERAVQTALRWLEDHHVITRDLRNQKSTVYTVTPETFDGESAKAVHYVYRITHKPSGRFYIGLRTSSVSPAVDPYFGSGACAAWLEARRSECVKEILGTFDARRDAAEFETFEISLAVDDPLCLNRRVSSPGSDGAAKHLGAGDAPAAGTPLGAGDAPVPPQHLHQPPAAPAPGTVIEPSIEPPMNRKPARSAKFDPLTACPANVSPEVWAEWCQHRKEIRKALTPTSCARQVNQLADHPSPDDVIRYSISNGWTGLFPDSVHGKPQRAARKSAHHGLDQIDYSSGQGGNVLDGGF